MYEWVELLKNDDYIGIKKYIKNGADVNEGNENGETVLAYAIREHCDFDTIMLLIENGADAFDFDDEGVSIFDMAITYNNLDVVKYLIEKEIDVNKTHRRSSFTGLMAAACYGRDAIIKILIQEGVNQEARDMKGFRAVDFARKMNKKSVLALLDFEEDEIKNTSYAR